MSTTLMAPHIATGQAHEFSIRLCDTRYVEDPTVESLDVETVISNPLLPADRKWAIRFNAGGTATLVLGMKDYGRGWFSGYFANVLTSRLGLPFRQVRVYYSAILPTVLQMPVPAPVVSSQNQIGPVARAVAEIIDGMCDHVIAMGRSAFAAMAGVATIDVGFDQGTGQFFILGREQSRTLLQIAAITRARIGEPASRANEAHATHCCLPDRP